MSKHTPGPWRTGALHNPWSVEGPPNWNNGVIANVCVESRQILWDGGRQWTDAERKAAQAEAYSIAADNARLIAAAPELLEVLLTMVDFWDCGTPVHPGAEIVQDARAAIAKATGKPHDPA